MKDFTEVLKDIAKQYKTIQLLYDARTYDLVESICNQYITKGHISAKQIHALVKISERITLVGRLDVPIAAIEPLQEGFLGINCKTGEAYWHSWQYFEPK